MKIRNVELDILRRLFLDEKRWLKTFVMKKKKSFLGKVKCKFSFPTVLLKYDSPLISIMTTTSSFSE